MTDFIADNDGVRIAWERRGPERDAGSEATPVVLVQGLGYGRWGWEPVVDDLATHHEVILLDNRGIGASDVPAGPYTAAGMATDVVAVLDATGVERAHVVGVSLGGMVAQEVALGWPDRVDRLVLVSTTFGGDDAHPIPPATRQLLARMPDMEPVTALRAAADNALGDVDGTDREQIVDRIVAHRTAVPQDPAGWQAQAHAGTTFDAADRVAGIDHQTLVLHGTDDTVVDVRNADLLARRLPHARRELVDGGGHLFFWERPEALVEPVLDFLAGR